MCRLPMIRVPASGFRLAYSLRMDISPGISCSARRISLRPNSASERSFTLYGSRPAAFAASNGCTCFSITVAMLSVSFYVERMILLGLFSAGDEKPGAPGPGIGGERDDANVPKTGVRQ